MYKLIAVTLAALYCVLLIFGDEARRPDEVARAEPAALTVVPASALDAADDTPVFTSRISDRQAVEMAIAAGKAYREEQRAAPARQRLAAASAPVTPVADTAETSVADNRFWYVTGSRVNLRGGPGTANDVVGQVTFGAEAEVLADQDGWYRIRLADGSASGWIFGKFLDENRPG